MKQVASIQLPMAVQQNQYIGEIVEKEGARLLQFIKKRVPKEQDAEDILQDVFFQLTESYRMMKPIEHMSSWLFTVARNKITDMFRKKKPENFSSIEASYSSSDEDDSFSINDILPDKSENLESAYLRKIIMQQVEEGLAELPQEQRDVFIMQEFEQMSFKDIAELTGEPMNTLISRKRYAVVHLRKKLQNIYNEFLQ